MWPSISVNSLDEFEKAIDMLNRFTAPTEPTVCFRGQANSSWGLVPSLPRMFPKYFQDYQIVSMEIQSIEAFQKRAHLLINPLLLPPEEQVINWLTIMQHYNAPTRLLDWTYSPYVALYFAVQDGLLNDGAIWYFDRRWMVEYMSTIFEDRYYWSKSFTQNKEDVPEWLTIREISDPNILLHYDDYRIPKTPRTGTERLIIQQGTFTISKNLRTDHSVAIDHVFSAAARAFGESKKYEDARLNYAKIIVKSTSKRHILRKLNEMNINASSLFPGVDGLGRSIAGLGNISSEFFEPAQAPTSGQPHKQDAPAEK